MEPFLKHIAEIIKEASKSVLGVLSLIIIAFTGLAYALLHDSDTPTRFYTLGMTAGFFVFIIAMLFAMQNKPLHNPPLNIQLYDQHDIRRVSQADPTLREVTGCFWKVVRAILVVIVFIALLVFAGYGIYFYIIFDQLKQHQQYQRQQIYQRYNRL